METKASLRAGLTPRVRFRATVVAVAALALVALPLVSSALLGAATITSPADGAIVASSTTIAGTAAPGARVEIDNVADGGSLGGPVADANGDWSQPVTLPDGSYTITATASDGDGNTAPPSAPVSFEVDATRPTITIDSPEDGHVFGAGEPLVIEGSASDERLVYALRLEYWHLDKLVLAEPGTCDGCGESTAVTWTNSPPLEPGYYLLRAFSYDSVGNRSTKAEVTFLVSGLTGVPIGVPEAPEDPSEVEVPELLGPEDDELVPGEQEPVEFSGTTTPGSTIEIKEEVQGFGTIGTAYDENRDGLWAVSVFLPTGVYGVRVQATDEDGHLSSLSDITRFEVDAELPTLANLTGDGSIFTPLQEVELSGDVADDRATYAVTLEFWLGDERVRHELAECPACGEQDAVWTSKPEGLDPGYYHVKVRAVDEAGQRSTVQVVTLTVVGLVLP